MSRLFAATVLAAGMVSLSAAADPPAGAWKLTLRSGPTPLMLLVAFSQADGKWVGDLVDSTAQFKQEPKFGPVTVTGNAIRFALTVGGQELVSFDGVVAKDGKKIAGSIRQAGGSLELTELRPSNLKKLTDAFELMRESLAQTDDPQGAFEAATAVLGQAAAKKLTADEARGIVDRVTKLNAGHGPRWERAAAVKFATLLVDQQGFADVALAQARRAERMLTDDDDAAARLEVLEPLAAALTKVNKPDEAKGYNAQVTKLEARDYQEYAKTAIPFPVEPYPGRKAKSDKVVLLETFTGAEFPPAAAFDQARDAVLKAYKPTEVIAVTYHIHLNGQGDPLTAPDFEERAKFYLSNIQKARLGIVDGKPAGSASSPAKEIYAALKERIDEQLEKPAGAKLGLAVTADVKGFTAKATVADLEKPGEQVFLRFAVAEERVRYAGGNGQRYHAYAVRAVPGGKGFPLKAKTAEQSVTVSPAELRTKQAEYLAEYAKESGEFARPDRPLAFKNLVLVAFVQNDSTGEVVAAARAELK